MDHGCAGQQLVMACKRSQMSLPPPESSAAGTHCASASFASNTPASSAAEESNEVFDLINHSIKNEVMHNGLIH
jgi:hypothetical protein